MTHNELSNPMIRQVLSLPELITQQYEDLEPKTRHLLTTPEIFSLRHIMLTGCGDSFAAGLAAKSAFEYLAKLPTEVVSAIDVARHIRIAPAGAAPNTPFLIAVSNSGQVARVGEAVKRITQQDGFTVGITGNRTSLLGQEAGQILELDIPDFESAPGIRSYLVSLLSLLLLAIRLGEVRGHYTMDKANAYRQEIQTLAFRLRKILNTMDETMQALADEWKAFPGFDFIGAGPDYASAWYGHAKIFEATGRYAMHVNTEEWLHLNFFIRDVQKTGTVLVLDKNSPSLSRAIETAHHIAAVGRPLLIVSTADKNLFPRQAHVVTLPDVEYIWLSPLVSFVPLALLAGYMATLLGEEYGRGAKDNWKACQNGATTRNSEIIIIGEEHYA